MYKYICKYCGIEFQNRNKGKKFHNRKCYELSKRGSIPWNKGKKNVMPVPWNKGRGGYHIHTEESLSKIKNALIGITRSKETRAKIGKAMKGQIPWNKGKKLTPEQIKNALRRRIPTRLEEAFSAIVQKHNLPYDYVGNGAFVIENCNPDFINTNHEKIAIEVYAKFYKELDGKTIKGWKERRNAIFKKYGWQVIYFEASEVNEKNVLEVLKSL